MRAGSEILHTRFRCALRGLFRTALGALLVLGGASVAAAGQSDSPVPSSQSHSRSADSPLPSIANTQGENWGHRSWSRAASLEAAALANSPSSSELAANKGSRKYAKVSLLRYKRPVRVGNEEVIVKFRAPGKKKSIMTFELMF